MLKKILAILTIAGSVTIVAIMTLSTPSQVGPVGVLALFVSLYFVVLSATTLLLFQVNKFVVKLAQAKQPARVLESMSLRRAYYFGSVIALGPVLLIGLQSVSGIGLYEVGLVLIFVVLGCTYVARRMP